MVDGASIRDYVFSRFEGVDEIAVRRAAPRRR